MQEPKIKYVEYSQPQTSVTKRMRIEAKSINIKGDFIIPEPMDLHYAGIALRNMINDPCWQKGMGKYHDTVYVEETGTAVIVYTVGTQTGVRKNLFGFEKITANAVQS